MSHSRTRLGQPHPIIAPESVKVWSSRLPVGFHLGLLPKRNGLLRCHVLVLLEGWLRQIEEGLKWWWTKLVGKHKNLFGTPVLDLTSIGDEGADLILVGGNHDLMSLLGLLILGRHTPSK